MPLTTGTFSDYGSVFQFPSGTSYLCQVVDFPELIEKEIEITNHAGGGVTEFIPSGLVEAGAFTLSVLNQPGVFATLKTAMTNKTVQSFYLSNPINVIQGFAMVTNVKAENADATGPNASKLTVTVRPTGALSVV